LCFVVAAVFAAPALLGAVGFTGTGVAGSSLAATAQSYFYGAWTCGVFSSLTSIGAGGMGVASTAVVGTTGGAVGGFIGSRL